MASPRDLRASCMAACHPGRIRLANCSAELIRGGLQAVQSISRAGAMERPLDVRVEMLNLEARLLCLRLTQKQLPSKCCEISAIFSYFRSCRGFCSVDVRSRLLRHAQASGGFPCSAWLKALLMIVTFTVLPQKTRGLSHIARAKNGKTSGIADMERDRILPQNFVFLP
jgi:hypothetical protein